MNLGYAEEEKGKSQARWVWTEMVYLWVGGAKLQAKMWQNDKNNIIFQRVWCVFVGLM